VHAIALSLLATPCLTTLRAAAPPRPVTFANQIAQLVRQNCAPCHRPGEAAPFPLLTYDDVKRHARQIAEVTKRRYMPPWLPTPDSGPFVEERRLTDAQIQLIQEWVNQGAPGGPAAAPATPAAELTPDWRLGPPDLILKVPKAFKLPAGGPEVFWNFIIPVPITGVRWVKAVEIKPGAPRAVHHASILLDRGRSAQKQHPGSDAGFAGMDLSIAETSFDPDGTFLAWKPGSVPMVEPDGMAWRAGPGMDLVFNVHLRPTGKEEVVEPSIALYFSTQPQTKFPMLVQLERDASIDIRPGARDYVVKDDFRCPMDLKVLAIYPHAHYLGRLMEAYATLPDGTRKILIRIPEWDLNWQGVYHFKEPLLLPQGSVISMRFHYDNSADNIRNPSRPPKRVVGGSNANDEMGNLWLQVLPAASGDQRAALEESIMRQRLDKDPRDFTAQFNIGDLLLSRNDAAGALPYFEAASKLQPRNLVAISELGVALASASRMQEAKAQFEKALQLDPNFTDARFDLASAEAALGSWEAAARNFQQVLEERPGDTKSRQHLGEVLYAWGDELARSGHPADAVQHYKQALEYRAGDAELYTRLGATLAQTGNFPEARAAFETALRITPGYAPARQMLAQIQNR
jgi:tetratricopeptide (TPR) repeat protein/mono/diheme cytochrome c family protein